jgi:hypothetical protein
VDPGAWGAHCALVAPAPPTTQRSVTVDSPEALQAEAAIDGSLITITGGWSQDDGEPVFIEGSDIDIVIPPTVTIGALWLGHSGQTPERVRIRGESPGQHSGGLMGQLRTGAMSDLIVDGIDINGAANYGPSEDNQAFRPNGVVRFAVLNTRVIAGAYGFLGRADQVFIANTNMYHGAATRAEVEQTGGWGIRMTGGPLTIVDSHIGGTRYVQIRTQSEDLECEQMYIEGSVLEATAEARSLWLYNNLNNCSPCRGDAAIVTDTDFYTYAQSCFTEEINAEDVEYSRIQNNRFHGAGLAVFTQEELDATAAAATGDHDWSGGNTFDTWASQAVPTWDGPGDPREIPLPDGLTLVRGDTTGYQGDPSCPGGP